MLNPVDRKKETVNYGRTTLHEAFRWTIFMYQIFGFMPVQGVSKPSIHQLKFSWLSFRTVFSILTIIGLLFIAGIQMTRFFVSDIQMADVLRLWYFMRSLLGGIFFFKMARNWRRFTDKWNRVDESMIEYGWPKDLKKKVNRVIVIIMVMVVVEYILILLQRFENEIISDRPFVWNMKIWNRQQTNFYFKYVFELVDYNFVGGLILLLIQLQVLLAGTFLDLFIMIISLTLASRIQQVAEKVKFLSASKNTKESSWKEVREDYNRLACLCKFLNMTIGPAILLSFSANLGLILIQLFNSLKVDPGIVAKLYLHHSLVFLLVRTVGVCLSGATVNDASRKPLPYLYGAPDSACNVEIDRLIRQITRDDVVLSGMRFFYIRKNLILQIAGSIVTYELVLVQFAGDFLKEHEIANRTYSL